MRTIRLAGDVTAVDALDLKVELEAAVREPRPIIRVDLRDVEHLNLASVSALVAASRAAERRRGQLHVLPPERTEARDVLDLAAWFPSSGDRASVA